MVFVVDPMYSFDKEEQYIRVEDTIVVTADGCERLTGAAPIDLDEVEAVMKLPSNFEPGTLGQDFRRTFQVSLWSGALHPLP